MNLLAGPVYVFIRLVTLVKSIVCKTCLHTKFIVCRFVMVSGLIKWNMLRTLDVIRYYTACVRMYFNLIDQNRYRVPLK